MRESFPFACALSRAVVEDEKWMEKLEIQGRRERRVFYNNASVMSFVAEFLVCYVKQDRKKRRKSFSLFSNLTFLPLALSWRL